MDSVASIFRRYEDVRQRLPRAASTPGTTPISSLLDIADRVDAFVFDAFGVLNVGDVPIPAATLRLLDDPAGYAAVDGVVFLSTEIWTTDRQALLLETLRQRPRPVMIANADLVAPRETGFTLEPGHFGHLLVDNGIPGIRFFGKPFPEVYQMIEASLPGLPVRRIAMCGDTLHTDILGAAARGWQTVLVSRDGLFSGADTDAYCHAAGLHPTWSVPRI